jgi:hypothetical protein
MVRGRPEKLKPRLQIIVSGILKTYPERKSRVIRDDLRLILLKDDELKKEFKDIDKKDNKKVNNFCQWVEEEKLPGVSAIAKLITRLNAPRELSPLDKPWSMASLTEHPLPFDAIPYILSFKDKSLLSIRYAAWVGRLWILEDETKKEMQRLYQTPKDDMSDESLKELADRIRKLAEEYDIKLSTTAGWYCLYERTCEKVGLVPVDTSPFDALSLDEIIDKFDIYFYGTKDTEIREDGVIIDKNTSLSVECVDNELERRWDRIKNKGDK